MFKLLFILLMCLSYIEKSSAYLGYMADEDDIPKGGKELSFDYNGINTVEGILWYMDKEVDHWLDRRYYRMTWMGGPTGGAYKGVESHLKEQKEILSKISLFY